VSGVRIAFSETGHLLLKTIYTSAPVHFLVFLEIEEQGMN
jgi:hypothetical protein